MALGECFMKKIKNARYSTIEELIEEVNALGDWKDPSQENAYFRILSKLVVLYDGYEFDSYLGKTRGHYPKEVLEAASKVCSSKFPSKDIPFDKNGDLKPGCPAYTYYLILANKVIDINMLGERTDIRRIAREKFAIVPERVPATQEMVESLIESSKAYMEKLNANQSQPE